ncbi:hypothetical protein Pogu_2115 [Pyrobaculum oguniense TE7]|uniref:Uncharacterized protein n=1 Tax=Pyrobaculum oguniense (strain DSM 13380 / JCM 10595 / TE7) TaxID=698757 RepID=H6QCU6_PYROT|nr:hypothetical protein Pogu_2115 [Pyrobaculum oguniense TE7]
MYFMSGESENCGQSEKILTCFISGENCDSIENEELKKIIRRIKIESTISLFVSIAILALAVIVVMFTVSAGCVPR